MASTAVVGSLIAGDSALRAMSTRMRNANIGSCSIVRSAPNATVARRCAVVDRRRAAVNDEQRFVGGDEVADLRHELDHAVVAAAPRARASRGRPRARCPLPRCGRPCAQARRAPRDAAPHSAVAPPSARDRPN